MKRKPLEMPSCPLYELSLLGSIVCHAFTTGDPFVLIDGHVDDTDFLDDGLGKLFGVMRRMNDAGIPIHNPLLLRTECENAKLPDSILAPGFILRLVSEIPNSAHLMFYADEVRDTAQKRRLINSANRLLDAAYDQSSDWRHTLGSMESDLARIAGNIRANTQTIGVLAANLVHRLREELNAPHRSSCMTGIMPLDEVMGPLMRKELIIVAARPGIGKTAFGMQLAMYAANRQRRAFFVSLEMSGEELATRVVCRIAEVNSRVVRAGEITEEMMERLDAAAQDVADVPVMVWAPPTGTLQQIRGLAKHLHAQNPLSVIVVDYLQFISAGAGERGLPRHEQIGVFTAGLRALAKELDVPVVAMAQLNREAASQEPTLANMRESGNIEQDANIVIGLHAEEPENPGAPFTVSAIILKHRAGMRGRVQLTFHPVETRFAECTTNSPQPPQSNGTRRRVPNRYREFDQP